MLYTIGTSNRSATEFYEELRKRGVKRVLDVRSKPNSRNQDFRLPNAMYVAEREGFAYAWQGEILGGFNEIATTKDAYRRKADALLEMSERAPLAIFCSEGHPNECHRSWKIGGYSLVQYGMITVNILRNGSEEDVTKTLLRTLSDDIPPCIREAALELSAKAEGFKLLPPKIEPVQSSLAV